MYFLRVLSLMAIGCAVVASESIHVKGVLIDKACSAKAEEHVLPTGIVGGMVVAEAHERQCLLMPACQKSGYGVFTFDQKFLTFDEEGNKKALEIIKASKKLVDLEIEVTGEIKGDTIKVATLKAL